MAESVGISTPSIACRLRGVVRIPVRLARTSERTADWQSQANWGGSVPALQPHDRRQTCAFCFFVATTDYKSVRTQANPHVFIGLDAWRSISTGFGSQADSTQTDAARIATQRELRQARPR